ncbi:isopropanol dehydrogenase [Metarhizium guizhouense ARSEF 977]|uniref:Isopropanol dehydrogenase n=1 Tax=Metarhizium guizhouense (strain ARSEF 977) TaxID=1276136 RepID=A0A0B4HR68_METGA|nr:isopropanol dehydrogenase [Metarhizium guizhouense ARSEF 977]
MTCTETKLPATIKAIVLHRPGQATVDSVPTPHPGPGSITIQVLHAMVHNAAKTLIKGTAGTSGHSMKQPYPNTPGGHGVGRVAASGPDTTAPELLRPGQLVIFDPLVRARDDGDVAILHGAFDGLDERTRAFARDSWRNGCWAEYVRAPLENTWPVGETVVVTPATGLFSGAAAAAAVSRSADKLARMEGIYPGLKTVVAGKTGNLTCGYCRPRPRGRCCGFQPPWREGFGVPGPGDSFPPADLTVRASWMYEREYARALVKMAELGVLKLRKAAGLEVIASYPLERMEEAVDKGLEAGASELVVIGPQ